MATQRDCRDYPLLVNERALRGFLARIDRQAMTEQAAVRRSFTRARAKAKA